MKNKELKMNKKNDEIMKNSAEISSVAKRIVEVLKSFGVAAEVFDVCEGPTVLRVKIMLSPGVMYSQVTELRENLRRALEVKSLRIEAPIPGEEYVGIEVPKEEHDKVSFVDTVLPAVSQCIIQRDKFNTLPIVIGKGVNDKTILSDLASLPHLIVGGASGQGKSEFLHTLICGLIASRSPDDVQFLITDSKRDEYSQYNGLPHLIEPVITDSSRIISALHWAVAETEKRLKMFAKASVRNIADFNSRGSMPQGYIFDDEWLDESDESLPKGVPYIVIVIDDFSGLMENVRGEIEQNITLLTGRARVAGIHLVLVTQRSDADVLPETILFNVPGRIAFKTISSSDSESILDDTGAEDLIGKGDCLFRRKDGIICRAQAPYIGDAEIEAIIAEVTRKWGDRCFE